MIATIGKTFINERQFTTDPHIRVEWKPWRSRLFGIGESVTQQDFGRPAKAMRLTLTGGANYINQAFKAYVEQTLMQTKRASWSYTDYTGMDADVVIVSFDAEPTFIRDGSGVLYSYTMVLDVVTLRKKDFSTYTGA